MPGTGKSRLVYEVTKRLVYRPDKIANGKYKTFRYRHYEIENLIVAGIYDGAVNDGTDRLSMAVMPDAIEFIQQHLDSNLTLLFEGDRLFTKNFLILLTEKMSDYYYMILVTSPDERKRRYKERGTNQSEKFIKGRLTKYNNIMHTQSIAVESVKNDNEVDLGIIINKILSFIHNE